MPANIDINRTQGSTSKMTFTITDELGGIQPITNWTNFELIAYVNPAREYSRTVTFNDTGGGTFTEQVRVIVGDTKLDADKEITVTTPSKRTVVVSSGNAAIPVFYKDMSDVVDFLFEFAPFLQGDSVASYLITSNNVTIEADYYNENQVQVWVKSGVQGSMASVSVAMTSAQGRTIERTFKLKIGEY